MTVLSMQEIAMHSTSSSTAIEKEKQFAAHNYSPLPVVVSRAAGCDVWDVEGHHYLDFLSAYSAVNQGHCHPELIKVLTEQAQRVTLISRAFYNDVFPNFAEFVTKLFGYEMVLPMNTGAEAVETAIKMARKWGYKTKCIPDGQAIVLTVEDNFHGRTLSAVSMSSDPESRNHYAPYLPNLGCRNPVTSKPIRYNNVEDIREVFEQSGKKIAALLIEPIQGEAGIVVPDDDYLQKVQDLCKKHQVLLMCDEIQTGIARTGKMLCHEWSNIRPDVVLLGKAISGGMYPVSCVLADKHIMLTFEPNTHGSTYGGNPLGSAIAIRALQLVQEENLIEKAETLGRLFRSELEALRSPIVHVVRGKGLLNALVLDPAHMKGRTAKDLCIIFKNKGLLSKPTHENIIRLAPPLVITDVQIRQAVAIIAESLREIEEGFGDVSGNDVAKETNSTSSAKHTGT